MKSIRIFKIAIFLILLLSFLLRVYRVAEVPSGLYWDEVDLGYQARSLLETGRDYRGAKSPFFVRSFNSDRTPIPAYFTALTTLIFNRPELEVRMAPVFLGTIVSGLAMWLVWLIIKKKLPTLLTGTVYAISPWQIQFSRQGFEAASVAVVFLSSLICFHYWLKTKKLKYFYFWIILLSLGVYTYRTMSLFVPLVFLVLTIIYFPDLQKLTLKHLIVGAVLAGGIILPFIYATTIGSADQTRINQISITSDREVPIWVQRNREIDSGDLQSSKIGRKASKSSFIFHNKLLSWWEKFDNNFIKSVSFDFLFLSGDPNPRHSVGKMGQLYLIDLIGLLAGVGWLVKNRNKKDYQWLIIWSLIAIIPSALTLDGANHAHRLYIFSLPLLIIVGLGWWQVALWIKSKKAYLLGLGLLSLVVVSTIFYLHRYLVHYPLESARSFSSGFKEAIQKITTIENRYRQIQMVDTIEPPIIHYLFWANVPPSQLQKYGTNFSRETKKNMKLDKYKVINWEKEMKEKNLLDNLNPDVLYLVTQREIPLDLRSEDPTREGIDLIGAILYPDKEVAFYLISKYNH